MSSKQVAQGMLETQGLAAVTAAGAQAVCSLGILIAAHVISRTHKDLIALLPK